MASLALAFDILAKDNASKALNNVGDAAERTGGLGKKMGIALAGAAAAGAAGLFMVLKGGAAEFADNQQAMAQFEAGLKSTKGAANVTADQMKALADSIEAKTGTDGAAVVSGGALLATFVKVRNEVGAGNDVFTRATQAGVDLAARGFGSVESNAILLGKALNDPVKGLTALGKQGVTFTAEQKKTIASLVKTGDVLGAQKIILKEIEGQVGGSAAAYGQTLPGQLARARAAFDGVKETVFTAVLPVLAQLLEFVSTRLIPGMQRISEQVGPVFTQVKDTVVDLATAAIPILVDAFQTVVGAIQSVVGFFREHDTAAKALGGIVAAVAAGVAAAWVAQAAVAVANSIRSVAAWVATATASTTSATIQSKSTAQIVFGWAAAAAGAVASVAKQVAAWVLLGVQSLAAAAKVALAWLISMGPIALVVAAVVALVVVIVKNWDTIKGAISAGWNAVKAATQATWDWIKSAIAAAIAFVVKVFLNFTGPGLIIKHWDTIKRTFSQGVDSVVGFMRDLPGKIVSALGDLGSLLVNAGKELIEGLISGITAKLGALKDKMASVANAVKGFLPGSPIKEGPLTSWNNGGAGLRLMGLLEQGIAAGLPSVTGTLASGLGGLPSASVGVTGASDLTGMGGGDVLNRLDRIEAAILSDQRRRQLVDRTVLA